MEWIKQLNGYSNETWKADGFSGYFMIWKDGNIWRGLYHKKAEKKVIFRFWKRSFKEAKKVCQDNYYWED